MSYYLEKKDILVNLIISVFHWSAASFTYYLIQNQLKYLPGNIYSNGYAIAFSYVFANLAAGFIGGWFGNKNGMTMCCGLTTTGTLLMIVFGWNPATEWMMPGLILITASGS